MNSANPIVVPTDSPLAVGPAHDPEIRLPKTQTVHIQIVCESQEAEYPCHFWVGLMSQGPLSPGSLLDFPEATAILTQAATQGVEEREALMLSDSRSNPPRQIYLIPRPEDHVQGKSLWIRDVIDTIQAWAPNHIGIYMAPSLIFRDSSHELMLTILRELIALKTTRHFFLFTGEHGLHSVLNAALKLKAELAQNPDTLPIVVFH